MKQSILALVMTVVMCFTNIGCSTPETSQLVTALNAVADASSVAVVITSSLVATGKVDPAIATEVSSYATNISVAVTASIAVLNGTEPNPQKIAAITAAFGKVAAPAFGENAPQIAASIDAVSAAVKIFLNRLTSSGLLKAANAAPNAKIVLEKGDKAKMKEIQKKAAEVTAQAVALKSL